MGCLYHVKNVLAQRVGTIALVQKLDGINEQERTVQKNDR